MKNIIFFRTDMLGDTLLNLPAIDALRAAYPAARIHFVCNSPLAELLRAYPAIDRVIPFEAGCRKAAWRELRDLFRAVSSLRADLAIVSNARKDLHAICFFSLIRRRIGYGRKWGVLLSDRLRDTKYEAEKHEIESNLDLLKPLGIRIESPVFALPVPESDLREALAVRRAAGIEDKDRLILVHPFSSDLRKCWPLEHFSELMCMIKHDFHAVLGVIGVEKEAASADDLAASVGTGAFNLAGRTPIRILAALMTQADLLIGHDSGPMHLAAGVGTKTVSLFSRFDGGPSPRRWRPWGNGHVILHEDLQTLASSDVYSHVKRALENTASETAGQKQNETPGRIDEPA